MKEFFNKANRYLAKESRIVHRGVPRIVLLGLTSVLLMYFSISGTIAITTPITANGDTPQHLDYAWRLSRGELPTRAEGITYPPFVELRGYRQQQQAAHPPLFYLLQAPIVAPLMNQGNWMAAVQAGRIFNILVGSLGVLSLAYASWVVGRSNRALFAVSVPALSVLFYRYTRLNLDFSFDALLVTFCSLTLAVNYKILTSGLTKKRFIALLAISVLGMTTKAPYIIFLIISLCSVSVATYLQSKGSITQKLLKASIAPAITMGVVMVSIGWFYYLQNYQVHGSWFTARPPDYTGGRTPKGLLEVITSEQLWSLFYGELSRYAQLSTAITSISFAGYLTLTKTEVKKYMRDKKTWALIFLCSLTIVGTFATQIEHAVGVGAINFRYMLPAIMVFGLFISYGFSRFTLGAELIAVSSIALGLSSLNAKAGGNIPSFLKNMLDSKPQLVACLALIFIYIVGATVLVYSLRLARRATPLK